MDAAFKYLMDDQAAARLLVGAVLGEEVESLQALPQERVGRSAPAVAPGEPPSGELLTVRRVDFAATVRTAAGERLRVLVEVQKARFTDEVMRFREYLGRHYADRDNYDEAADGRRRHRSLRAIYILGECLPRTTATVLRGGAGVRGRGERRAAERAGRVRGSAEPRTAGWCRCRCWRRGGAPTWSGC